MKQQVARLSPHQNGKVFAVLTALGSFLFLVPVIFIMSVTVPADAPGTPPLLMLVIAPLMYLLIGYVSVAIGCMLYNWMFKYIGGIEYESDADEGRARLPGDNRS
jgi:hypothetical protein